MADEKKRRQNGEPRAGKSGNVPPVEHRFKPGNQASKGVSRGKGHGVLNSLRRAMKAKNLRIDSSNWPVEPQGERVEDAVAASIIVNVLKGNGTAIKQVLDRLEGPVPTVHEGGDKDKPIRVSNADIDRLINDPEAVAAADRLLDILGRGKADPGGPSMDGEREEV